MLLTRHAESQASSVQTRTSASTEPQGLVLELWVDFWLSYLARATLDACSEESSQLGGGGRAEDEEEGVGKEEMVKLMPHSGTMINARMGPGLGRNTLVLQQWLRGPWTILIYLNAFFHILYNEHFNVRA